MPPDGDTDFFDIVTDVLQGGALASHLFIICLDYVLQMSLDLMKENGFTLKKARSRRYSAQTIMDTDYTDDVVLMANTPTQAACGIGLHVNADKMEFMYFNQKGDLHMKWWYSETSGQFTDHGSSILSIENDINTQLMKAYTAINRLTVI